MSAADLEAVRDIVAACIAADAVAPMSEQATLTLGGDGWALVAEYLGIVVGVAAVDQGSAEVAVHPGQRRRGVGTALLNALPPRLAVWAHGSLPPATALAASLGYAAVRELWQLRRDLDEPLPEAVLPAGFTLRTFRPGIDDEAWLALNAAAFADHPEQGRWTITDLRARMASDWFDPAGFLLAISDTGAIAGFHWTKLAPGTPGEVYVLGVAPAFQGRGLSRPLTLAGLHHLRGRSAAQVMLYVEESNAAARHLYASLGFSRSRVDRQYRKRLD